MKNSSYSEKTSVPAVAERARNRGFSLIELVVAMAVFTLIAGAAFDLVARNQPAAQQQQMLSGLNISLRNAAALLQTDLSNAGTGYFVGANQPSFPLGVAIQNQTTSSCNNATNYTYSASCFDSLSIIMADTGTNANFVPLALTPAAAINTTTGTLTALPQTGDTATTDASYFKSGDEILIVQTAYNSTTNGTLCTVQLTAGGAVSGSSVKLTFTPTGTGCVWSDPLGVANNASTNMLTHTFTTSSWIIRLNPVLYYVDTTTLGSTSNPVLVREQGGTSTVVADEIIGFKVGAALWTDQNNDWTGYVYNPLLYSDDGNPVGCGSDAGCDPYNYTLIQALRLTIIGRTTPMPSISFRNNFDQGPYNISVLSFIVNPRNLSMNNQ